jgi:hypothetical protein
MLPLLTDGLTNGRNAVIEVIHQHEDSQPHGGTIDVVGDDASSLGENRLPGGAEPNPKSRAQVTSESVGVVALVEHRVLECAGQCVNSDPRQSIGRNPRVSSNKPDGRGTGREVEVVTGKRGVFERKVFRQRGSQERDLSLQADPATAQPAKIKQ